MEARRLYRSEPILNIQEYLFSEEKFDKKGNVISKLTYDADGNVISKEMFSYSTENRITEHRRETDAGIELKEYSYVLQENTHRVLKTYVNSNISIDTISFKYEEDGSYWESHYSDGKLLKNTHFNSQGLLIEEFNFFSGTGSIFNYDAQGELIYSEVRFGNSDFIEEKTYEVTYNENKKVVRRLEINSKTQTIYEYDSEGRLLKSTVLSEAGEIFQTFRYEYVP